MFMNFLLKFIKELCNIILIQSKSREQDEVIHWFCDRFIGFSNNLVGSTTFYSNAIDLPSNHPMLYSSLPVVANSLKRRCPKCDSSVRSYCTDKLFHDSCCCYNPQNSYDELPYQCRFADCSFLHANSCPEHELITACCCTNYLLYKK
ncbi:hypothetical protein JTB14_000744 [Gonioctena quinquepunctata]|nr:hypothetical protein JTB14_000744 [Gonioctena quinquepunctata]